jgi:hypothetical protein
MRSRKLGLISGSLLWLSKCHGVGQHARAMTTAGTWHKAHPDVPADQPAAPAEHIAIPAR